MRENDRGEPSDAVRDGHGQAVVPTAERMNLAPLEIDQAEGWLKQQAGERARLRHRLGDLASRAGAAGESGAADDRVEPLEDGSEPIDGFGSGSPWTVWSPRSRQELG